MCVFACVCVCVCVAGGGGGGVWFPAQGIFYFTYTGKGVNLF